MKYKKFTKRFIALGVSGILALSTGNLMAAEAVSSDKTEDKSGDKAGDNENGSEWNFAVFGNSTKTEMNGYEGDITDGSVRVYSLNGSGKIVAKSTDGMAFYYTSVPVDKNFTLKATAHVNNWYFSNGQEGFGIAALDRVGEGQKAFWNNSYMSVAMGYSYTNTSGEKINMKNGISSIAKTGVDNDNLYYFEQQDADTINAYFNSSQDQLEDYCDAEPSGNYNIIGNSVDAAHEPEEGKSAAADYTPIKLEQTVKELTDFNFILQKNNTGYFCSYEDENGKVHTKKYYTLGDETLNKLDADNVYVGFFAARNFDVTFDNMELTLIDPADDAPAETPENTYIDLDADFRNADHSNLPEQTLRYYSNWDGHLKVSGVSDNVIFEDDIKSDQYAEMSVSLSEGKNVFKADFTPSEDFHLGYDENHPINLYNVLEDYSTVQNEVEIEYDSYAELGDRIYTSPKGSVSGNGTKESPFDIATAARFVQPGQTIVLMEGTYEYAEELKLFRGIDGTESKPIYMVADEAAATRPVLDFTKQGRGLILGGDYWHYKGFDVTNSVDGVRGVQLAGSNCVLEDIHAYYNGNTGIQVTRYWGYDNRESGLWPHDDLVLNCTSYENADKGYEDADGFAAKLNVGDNVVFDGCIAHNNADDGWDLFARTEVGPIGAVTIKNCVAYMNGYIHVKDREDTVAEGIRGTFSPETGFTLDPAGDLAVAGNGNGFKLGGDGVKGGHTIQDSFAFMNKLNGITSNSCPDIHVINDISFDNGKSNIALYTGATVENTDFTVQNFRSVRKNLGLDMEELLNCKGTQENGDLLSSDNYFYSVEKSVAENAEGTTLTEEDFVSLTFDPNTQEIERNEDGSIKMDGFMQLKENSAASENDADGAETENAVSENGVSDNEADNEVSQGGFFTRLIEAIKDFFSSIFNS